MNTTETQMLALLSKRHHSINKHGLPRWVYAQQVPLVHANRRIDAIALDSRNIPLHERRDYYTLPGITTPHTPTAAPPLDVHGFEVKVSRADWLTEYRTKGTKSAPWRAYCSHWWIVTPTPDIIAPAEHRQAARQYKVYGTRAHGNTLFFTRDNLTWEQFLGIIHHP